MKTSKCLSVLLGLVTAVWVLSSAVAVPLLCRPFYDAHIEPLHLTEQTGLTAEQIRQAYDQVMDYCLGLQENFSAGIFPFSQEGAAHFADVQVLFRLDLAAAGVSALALILLYAVGRSRKLEPYRFCGHGPGFWSAAGLGGAFVVIGGLAALDFDRSFRIFHALFFPGQDNWLFSIYEDPVILILPEEFFRNCAILILALILVWCVVLIGADRWANRRRARALEKLSPCQRRALEQ